MNILFWLLFVLIVFVIVAILAAVVLLFHRASYKNRAIIFRRTGNNMADYLIYQDRFRVNFEDGVWVIKFLRLSEMTKSVDGRFFVRFFRPKYQKVLFKVPREEWDRLDFSDKIQRGLVLYETREGHYFPMKIKEQESFAEFETDFSQDNRNFLANQTIQAANLTRNKRQDKLILMALIIGSLVLGAITIAAFYFLQRNAQSNVIQSAMVCSEYARSIINVTTSGSPHFLDNIIAGTLGG
jgi:flagellar basal body-associated protein FliL